MVRVLGAALIAAAASVPAPAEPPLALSVSPRVAYEPGRFAVRTTVARDPGNEAVEIVIEFEARKAP